MIKQVSMMTTLKTNNFEAQFIANGHPDSVKRHEARMTAFRAEVQEAEQELDALLNDGYRLVTQYEIELQDYQAVVMVLHRPERTES